MRWRHVLSCPLVVVFFAVGQRLETVLYYPWYTALTSCDSVIYSFVDKVKFAFKLAYIGIIFAFVHDAHASPRGPVAVMELASLRLRILLRNLRFTRSHPSGGSLLNARFTNCPSRWVLKCLEIFRLRTA
jgi:hypothetical protein